MCIGRNLRVYKTSGSKVEITTVESSQSSGFSSDRPLPLGDCTESLSNSGQRECGASQARTPWHHVGLLLPLSRNTDMWDTEYWSTVVNQKMESDLRYHTWSLLRTSAMSRDTSCSGDRSSGIQPCTGN